jgi:hypothetical protein
MWCDALGAEHPLVTVLASRALSTSSFDTPAWPSTELMEPAGAIISNSVFLPRAAPFTALSKRHGLGTLPYQPPKTAHARLPAPARALTSAPSPPAWHPAAQPQWFTGRCARSRMVEH